MPDLPPPRDRVDRYLVAIHDRLGELLDRLPPAPSQGQASAGGEVELREPAAPASVGGGEEPSSAPEESGSGPDVTKRRPARSASASAKGGAKTTPRRRAAKPEEN
ncbi:hypothetical protein [Actinomadura litoris]|uniref:hypothetical protein n=1 Tax=Actinomadura litoris TaxID=2678616 RepID=UPI001FA73BED|nr:hypothetical protein [Actinomadura litoris]